MLDTPTRPATEVCQMRPLPAQCGHVVLAAPEWGETHGQASDLLHSVSCPIPARNPLKEIGDNFNLRPPMGEHLPCRNAWSTSRLVLQSHSQGNDRRFRHGQIGRLGKVPAGYLDPFLALASTRFCQSCRQSGKASQLFICCP